VPERISSGHDQGKKTTPYALTTMPVKFGNLAKRAKASSVRSMRYLALIAVFSLQMGMFVCGAGMDVCHAADAPAHFESSQPNTDHGGALIDQACVAHAAHVFLGQPGQDQGEPETHVERAETLASLNLPEILHLIEQPPKFLHS
jgi:hypothetical protein